MTLANKKVLVNFGGMLEDIDKAAKYMGLNRTDFLKVAANELLVKFRREQAYLEAVREGRVKPSD